MNECECKCMNTHDEAYAFDAAGQKVYAGDYVLASLPNVPAVRTARTLHPCRVLSVQKTLVRLLYIGGEPLLARWSREPFLRGNREVAKADLSGLGLGLNGGHGGSATACCGCRYRSEEECFYGN